MYDLACVLLASQAGTVGLAINDRERAFALHEIELVTRWHLVVERDQDTRHRLAREDVQPDRIFDASASEPHLFGRCRVVSSRRKLRRDLPVQILVKNEAQDERQATRAATSLS